MELKAERHPVSHRRRETLPMETAGQHEVIGDGMRGEGMDEIEVGAVAVAEERGSPCSRDDAVPSDMRHACSARKPRDAPRQEPEAAALPSFFARLEEKLHPETDAENSGAGGGGGQDGGTHPRRFEPAGRLRESADARQNDHAR